MSGTHFELFVMHQVKYYIPVRKKTVGCKFKAV